MLYIRMFLIMGVSLITFRLLLQQLGEVDYGIYNVVGGVVILFSFLNSAMMQSSQRFFSYYIGNGDEPMLRKMFAASIWIHLGIALVVVALAETVGLWFLNRYMSFPPGSMTAVNIVYQCTIVTFLIQIMIVPHQSMIISQESMSFFAYLSIAEVILKLSAVLILMLFSNGKLVVYGIALVVVSTVIATFYRLYCVRKFQVCRGRLHYDKESVRRIAGFSGWNTLGGIGNVGASQGVNIVFNVFCGVVVNAAMGVANQVLAAVGSFVSNFQTAFNPQIIKLYASGEIREFDNLIFRASRISFCLIFILGFPIIILAEPIMSLWLTVLPPYSVRFTQLVIIVCMLDAISGPLWTAAQACGKIKNYMIIISLLIFSNVPAAIVILWCGLSPVWVIGYRIFANMIIHLFRIIYLHRNISFPAWEYIRTCMVPIAILVLVALPLAIFMNVMLPDSILIKFLEFVLLLIECIGLTYIILLKKEERIFLREKISILVRKLHSK